MGSKQLLSLSDTRKQKNVYESNVVLNYLSLSITWPFSLDFELFLLSCLQCWTSCVCMVIHVNVRLLPRIRTVAPPAL